MLIALSMNHVNNVTAYAVKVKFLRRSAAKMGFSLIPKLTNVIGLSIMMNARRKD